MSDWQRLTARDRAGAGRGVNLEMRQGEIASRLRFAEFSAETLQWAVGLYCGFVSSFLLVAPNRFVGPPYSSFAPFRGWWGTAALAGGVGMLALTMLHGRPGMRIAVHGTAGLVLLSLGGALAGVSGWTGAIVYGLLGLGTIAAVWLRRRSESTLSGDFFGLLMGLIAVCVGVVVSALPSRVPASALETNLTRLLCLALAISGSALFWVQLRRSPRPAVARAVHFACGASLVLFGFRAALPQPAWTGIAFYWGCGTGVAFLPWFRAHLGRVDTAALRTRLALALAIATSLALIGAVAVVTAQEEGLATSQAEVSQQAEAKAIARDVRDYVEMKGAQATAVASLAGRLPMSGELQGSLLAQSLPAYPGTAGLLALNRDGKLLAAAGSAAPDAATLHRVADRHPRAVPVTLAEDAETHGTLLLVSSPIVGLTNEIQGVLVMVLDPAFLTHRIGRPASSVLLDDGHGHPIAGVQDSGPATGRRALVASGLLTARARVADLGWDVSLERPRALVLAGMDRGRDLAFGLLLLVVPLAVAGGILSARLITRPLAKLGEAVGELTAGNLRAPLDASGITEVEHLSAAFREMRRRLALRTVESERLAGELRARADALAESDRRKDEFLAMLAHELRNPLGAISTSSHVLAQLDPGLPPIQRSVAIIQRQIQHLVRLVDDLLDISRITRGKIELRSEPLDLVEVVRHALEATRPQVAARQHQIEISLPEEPLPLLADATRLEQVFANLIANAAKFTEPGGRITVVLRREDREAVLRVRDNGMGIGTDLLPRIFDLFTQGQQGLDRSVGGLGIGLTLVRSLIEMHGGRVEALSDGPGHGAEFLVRLPLAPLATASPVPLGLDASASWDF